MEEKTKSDYRKLAQYHYKIMGKLPYYSAVKSYLESIAHDLRPDYYRKLRNAIAFEQEEQGYIDNAKQINSIKNPMTQNIKSKKLTSKKNNTQTPKIKLKQNRVKFINDDDMKLIKQAVSKKKDFVLSAVLGIIQLTGCRPAEVKDIRILKDNKIFIKGAKKTEAGNRGLDRIIVVNDKIHKFLAISKSLINKQENFDISKYQNKFKYQMEKLFPRRKYRPNFYTFRHMHGSKLKNSDFSSHEVAYLMGHQSTESIKKYGDKRHQVSKSSLVVKPAIPVEKIKLLVRDNKTDYSQLGKTKAIKVNNPEPKY